MGSGGGNGDMEEMNTYPTISLKKSDGGDDHKKEGLTMTAAISSWRLATLTTIDGGGDRP